MTLKTYLAISLDQLVPADHVYHKFVQLLDFKSLAVRLQKLENNKIIGAKGYGIEILFRCLVLQFIEDVSDRELEKMLQENTAAKYFCGFQLCEQTPDFSLLSKTRKKIGPEQLGKLFTNMREQLRAKGYINEVFNFVDARHLVSKASLWQEHDEAIKKRYEQLNNQSLPKVAKDKQARIGCKGANKYWYGYKEHVSVDMQAV